MHKANKTYELDEPVNIIRMNSIRIRCYKVEGLYKNGKNDHTRTRFIRSSNRDSRLLERRLTNISERTADRQFTLTIVDHDGGIVDFRREIITVRLHL